jgi:hypothetical protein
MLLNALQHMRITLLLWRKSQHAPQAQRSRFFKRAALHEANAKSRANDPSLSPEGSRNRATPDLPEEAHRGR